MTRRTAPVLLVHGFASSFDLNWARNGWVDFFADAKREVIAVDLLGHGDAPKPHDPLAYGDLTERVLAAVPSGAVVDAIGFSLGAVTLARAAGVAPERFGRIVLGGIGRQNMVATDPEPVADAIERGLTAVGNDESAENRMARAFAQFAANGTNDPAALAACLRRPGGPLREDELALIRAETLVVTGDRDFVMPLEPVVKALTGAALVRSKTLRGVDHFGTPQAFGFIDAALEFLEALPA